MVKPSYIPKIDHRNNNPNKSQWTITESEEIDCFNNSFSSQWIDQFYTSWGLYFDNNEVSYLGISAKNEPESCQLFIAKFIDSNQNNEWHGYPANHSRNQQDIPPETVTQDWIEKEYLRRATIRKITRGQKCKL
ncbi:MAG: hypothetical protein F6K31_04460 [Symploca sp. SIO2G7]|nr:hypothetical protein [Symploca sp. SIO2G7]